ncbi:MAG: sulfur carrier protein ThiS [Desulfobulbaceae bacterium]
MNIICNGEPKDIQARTTLHDLALSLGLNPQGVVAELNGKIVEHGSFAQHPLQDGDRVELIRFVGGG